MFTRNFRSSAKNFLRKKRRYGLSVEEKRNFIQRQKTRTFILNGIGLFLLSMIGAASIMFMAVGLYASF